MHSCTSAHTHTRAYRHTAEYARTAQKFLEVWRGSTELYDSAVEVCFLLPVRLSVCHLRLIRSFSPSSVSVSPLLERLCSALALALGTHAALFTVFVSLYVRLSAGAHNVTDSVASSRCCFRHTQWSGKLSRNTQWWLWETGGGGRVFPAKTCQLHIFTCSLIVFTHHF